MMNEEYMFFMSDMLSDLYEEQQEEFANCFKEVPYEI